MNETKEEWEINEMNFPPGLKLKLMGTIGEIAAHGTGNSKWPHRWLPRLATILKASGLVP